MSDSTVVTTGGVYLSLDEQHKVKAFDELLTESEVSCLRIAMKPLLSAGPALKLYLNGEPLSPPTWKDRCSLMRVLDATLESKREREPAADQRAGRGGE